jgi:hypothetical protein
MRTDRVSRPLSITQALKGDRVGPAVRKNLNTSSINALPPHTAPPSTRPWPSRYLVAEWITRSAPIFSGRCRAGVQKQLSTTSKAPPPCATCANAAMSNTSVSGFEGVSMNTSLVFGRIAARKPSSAPWSTKLVSMPKRGRMAPNNCWVAPKMLREATICSPAFIKAITVARIAAMPLAVATQASAPSRAARRSCSVVTVGLVKRA